MAAEVELGVPSFLAPATSLGPPLAAAPHGNLNEIGVRLWTDCSESGHRWEAGWINDSFL